MKILLLDGTCYAKNMEAKKGSKTLPMKEPTMTTDAATLASIANEVTTTTRTIRAIAARHDVTPATVYNRFGHLVRPAGCRGRGRPSLMLTKPDLVATMRRTRFLHPEKTDAEVATMCGVCVPTFRKYVDSIPSPRRIVSRLVNMRSAACYAVTPTTVARIAKPVNETSPARVLFNG